MSNETNRVVTPAGRLIFDRFLFEGDSKKRDKKSAAILIPEGEDFAALQEMCVEAANLKWPKGVPKGAKMPIKKTDTDKHETHPHMKGMMILNAGTKFEVPVILKNGTPLTREDIKAGDDVRFSVSAWAYDVDGNKGVALNLHAVLKEATNEAFTSVASPADMFAGFTTKEEKKDEGSFDNFGF